LSPRCSPTGRRKCDVARCRWRPLLPMGLRERLSHSGGAAPTPGVHRLADGVASTRPHPTTHRDAGFSCGLTERPPPRKLVRGARGGYARRSERGHCLPICEPGLAAKCLRQADGPPAQGERRAPAQVSPFRHRRPPSSEARSTPCPGFLDLVRNLEPSSTPRHPLPARA
jgi:hypothetical protein